MNMDVNVFAISVLDSHENLYVFSLIKCKLIHIFYDNSKITAQSSSLSHNSRKEHQI
jgi:hypothetical protein